MTEPTRQFETLTFEKLDRESDEAGRFWFGSRFEWIPWSQIRDGRDGVGDCTMEVASFLVRKLRQRGLVK